MLFSDYIIQTRAVTTLADVDNARVYELPASHRRNREPGLFVERQDAKKNFMDLFKSTDRFVFWVCYGSKASGKKSLLQEVAAEASKEGMRVVRLHSVALCRRILIFYEH